MGNFGVFLSHVFLGVFCPYISSVNCGSCFVPVFRCFRFICKFRLRSAEEQLLGSKLNVIGVASKYAAKSLALVYDWYSQAIADTPTGRVSNLRVVSTLM